MKKVQKKSSPKKLSSAEFGTLNEKLDFLVQRVAMGSELAELKREVGKMEKKWEERFKLLIEVLDKHSKQLNDIQMETSGTHMQLARHEQWIKLLADKTGIKLPH